MGRGEERKGKSLTRQKVIKNNILRYSKKGEKKHKLFRVRREKVSKEEKMSFTKEL